MTTRASLNSCVKPDFRHERNAHLTYLTFLELGSYAKEQALLRRALSLQHTSCPGRLRALVAGAYHSND